MINDAKNRSEKLQLLVREYKETIESLAIKNGSKKADLVLRGMLVNEYRHNPDPVIWIAAIRNDVTEITKFISDCKIQENK